VAASFDNPDWVDVTLRWDEAEPVPASKWLSGKVKATKTLALPAIYLQGDPDGVNRPKTSEKVADKFIGPFESIVLPGSFSAARGAGGSRRATCEALRSASWNPDESCNAWTTALSRCDLPPRCIRLMGSADIGIARECRPRPRARA
jgi:hypothetical protein